MGKITRKELNDELNNELDSYSTKNELQTLDNKVMSYLAEIESDVNDRGVNLRSLGFKLDGVTDEGQKLLDALTTYKNLICPPDGIIATSVTIKIPQDCSLVGSVETNAGYTNTSRIKYIGEQNRQKSVVIIGENEVGEEPTKDATNIKFKNFLVDANNLAGFGVYGTYLTNGTEVDNVKAINALEYNQYYAKGWYAKLTRLIGEHGKNNGLAFGVPIIYSDGSKVSWTSPSPLELNNCIIDDLRGNWNGKRFSEDNPNTYDPTNENIYNHGYGIGFGIGNSFNATNYIAEANGGVGVYILTDSQPIKSIKAGYIESNCRNSGLDPATKKTGMIIEHTSNTGGAYTIEDLYMKYEDGGIFFKGKPRNVWLKNVHQPRFLKSLDGLTLHDLYSIVLKDNVYHGCGTYNTHEGTSVGVAGYKTVNTRYSYTVDCLPYRGMQLIYIKGDKNGRQPLGSYRINFDDGTSRAVNFPTELKTDEFVYSTHNEGKGIVSIVKAGETGELDAEVTFKIVNQPLTIL